jgi:hypothetical protein
MANPQCMPVPASARLVAVGSGLRMAIMRFVRRREVETSVAMLPARFTVSQAIRRGARIFA